MENGKALPTPRGTSFPDYCSFIFIKEVDTLSRTLLPGGGGWGGNYVVHDF